MSRVILALLPFIKELFFDRKEEMDFSSYKFNVKKWIRYVLFLMCFAGTLFFGFKSVSLSKSILDVKKRYRQLEVMEKSEAVMIKGLEKKVSDLETQNDVLQTRCLNPDSFIIPKTKTNGSKVKKQTIDK